LRIIVADYLGRAVIYPSMTTEVQVYMSVRTILVVLSNDIDNFANHLLHFVVSWILNHYDIVEIRTKM
jgi:hypothetical protein